MLSFGGDLWYSVSMSNGDLKNEIVFDQLGYTYIKKETKRHSTIPSTPGFVGKEEEIKRLKEEFALRHIFIVQGMAGSGKTYLGAYFARQMEDSYRIFFGECQSTPGITLLLKEINDFLVAEGEMGFDLILEEPSLDKFHKIKNLIAILERGNFLLILDDFHYLNEKEQEELIIPFDKFSEKTRLILLTRKTPHLIRSLKPTNVTEISIAGLSEDESILYLSTFLKTENRGILREIFRKTGGLPLALNLFVLLSRYYRIEELLLALPSYAKEVINREFIDRVFATLAEDEIQMLTRFSVFREPVPPKVLSFLYPEGDWEKIFVGLVEKLQLKRTEDDRIIMQPLIRQFAYERCREKRRSHITAARYYQSLDPDLKNGLEAYHHYSEAGESHQEVKILTEIGDKLIRKGQAELLYKMITHSIETDFRKNPELRLLLGKVLQLWGRFDEAITEYEEAFRYSTDPEKKALAQNQIGGVYLCKGDYEKAQNFFEESLSLRKKIEDEGGIAESLHQIGVLHLVKEDYSQASRFLEESLKITRSLGDKVALAETLNEIGRVYFYQKDYQGALLRLNEALSLSRGSGNRRAEATIIHNMGSIYLEIGNPKEAFPLFEESLKIREEIGDRLGLARTLHQLGNLYLEEKDREKAKDHIKRSCLIFEELGSGDAQYPRHLLEIIENADQY